MNVVCECEVDFVYMCSNSIWIHMRYAVIFYYFFRIRIEKHIGLYWRYFSNDDFANAFEQSYALQSNLYSMFCCRCYIGIPNIRKLYSISILCLWIVNNLKVFMYLERRYVDIKRELRTFFRYFNNIKKNM